MSLKISIWLEGLPCSKRVNSLHLEAEAPPALTGEEGWMNPVDGQLLANLPDLGVKEEGWVNDGLLSRNPHLGVVYLHFQSLGLIHLLQNTTHIHTQGDTHTYVYNMACNSLQNCPGPTQSNVLNLLSPPLSHAAAPSSAFHLQPLSSERAATSWLLTPPVLTLLLFPSLCLSSLRRPLSIIDHWNSQTVMIWLLNDFRSGLHYSECGCNIV